MSYRSPAPSFLGIRVLDFIDLHSIVDYIDWNFFFYTWQIPGKYPEMEKLCECPSCKTAWLLKFPEETRKKAEEALKLFTDAREVLKIYISNGQLTAKAILYFSRAKSENDGITFYFDSENREKYHIPMLRQQKPNEKSGFCYSLSDFISSQQEDYMGAFAVTIHGAEEIIKRYQEEGDEYSALLIRSIADRLAEAASEWLHEQVRKQYWGYSSEEKFSVEELRKVRYQGIRPAIGYPCIPDQSVIFELNQILHVEQIGITLTESGLMLPNASVCGLYFSHPAAFYFMIGKIGEDQLKDYAARRGYTVDEMKKWLARNG
jgi:5-methyltetrahydrofolate--homocysteine methyltransferase